MASLTDTIYNLADSYTTDSITNVTNAHISAAGSTLMGHLINAHDAGDIIGTYTYYSDITSSPDDATLGLNAIKETALKTKIRGSNAIFNFKNTVNSKYIIIHNKRCFLYTALSKYNEAIGSFNLQLADQIYTGTGVTSQYNSSLDSLMNNKNNHI